MGETRVTEKFQVTIPKDIREKIGLKPGEVLLVESAGEKDLVMKRFRVVREPLSVLVGRRKFKRHIPVRELEEKMESE